MRAIHPIGPSHDGAESRFHGLRRGRLIVIEGAAGSGRGRLLRRLQERLRKLGYPVVIFKPRPMRTLPEPLRHRSHTPVADVLFRFAVLADQIEEVLKPALIAGKVVLVARYVFAPILSGIEKGLDPEWLTRVGSCAPEPDLAFYLESRPDALKRPEQRARHERRRALAESLGLETVPATLEEKGRMQVIWDRVVASVSPLAPSKREAGHELFVRMPGEDSERIRLRCLHPQRGRHFFFRTLRVEMQSRLAGLLDLAEVPTVFLHGNPHLDNYARTDSGSAMIDFDRARMGPYVWDLSRLMVSLSMRRRGDPVELLPESVIQALKRGYIRGAMQPELEIPGIPHLDRVPRPPELDVRYYVNNNMSWAARMREGAIATTDPKLRRVLEAYLAGRLEQDLLNVYDIREAGVARGTMGQGRFLILLTPRRKNSKRAWILIDLKSALTFDDDSAFFSNPFESHGERLLKATALYAPGMARGEGYAQVDGEEYVGRHIPPFRVKLRPRLSNGRLEECAYAIAAQLGRAHRLSVDGLEPAAFIEDFKTRFPSVLHASSIIRDEMMAAWTAYAQEAEAALEREGSKEGDDKDGDGKGGGGGEG